MDEDHVFHELEAACNFYRLRKNIEFYLHEFQNELRSGDVWHKWKMLLGEQEISFPPNGCEKTSEKVGFILFDTILNNFCRCCIFKLIYELNYSNPIIDAEDFQVILTKARKNVGGAIRFYRIRHEEIRKTIIDDFLVCFAK